MDLNILLEWFKHYNYVCIPILAFLIDTIIGDPNSKFHPVALIGRVISFYEAVFYKDTDNDTKKLWYGGIAVGFILLTIYIIASLILWIGSLINEWVESVSYTHLDVYKRQELMGGTTFAKDCVEAALKHGKSVVTANKDLLAEAGPYLFDLAYKNHVDLRFEASVDVYKRQSLHLMV